MKFLFFLLLLPFAGTAQKKNTSAPTTFEGVWAGLVYNDTTRASTAFELAIIDKGKKYSGFTYTVFLVDGKENIGIKSVKIKTAAQGILVEDEKLLDDNYDAPAAKGVRTFFDLKYQQTDSGEVLSGTWKTNITREFSSVTGTVFLIKQQDPEATAIIPRLKRLQLAEQLSVLSAAKSSTPDIAMMPPVSGKKNDLTSAARNQKEEKTEQVEPIIPDTTIVNPEITVFMFPKTNKKPAEKADNRDDVDSAFPVVSAQISRAVNAEDKQLHTDSGTVAQQKKTNVQLEAIRQGEIALSNKRSDESASGGRKAGTRNQVTSVAKEKSADQQTQKKDSLSQSPVEITRRVPTIDAGKREERERESVSQYPEKNIEQDIKLTERTLSDAGLPASQTHPIPASNGTDTKPVPPTIASMLAMREIETIRTVEIAQDTLIFSLFDNGVIDGDTVSVFLNDQVVMSKVGLRGQAVNDTIYLHPGLGDSIKIILYAENLGSIPPNTGLLVIRERGKNHEIRFSGDLQKNSAIILKRKQARQP